MIGIFRQKNPGNVFLLLIYGLVLKFSIFLKSTGPLQQPDDHFLYTWILKYILPVSLPAILFSLLSFSLLFLQATLFNRICNAQKILPTHNYLPGMAYLLITSLFPEWNQFSAPLLINSFLIWIFYRMVNLYNTQKPAAVIFNIGVMMGVVSLLYQPGIVFVLLMPFTLFIMRPFRIREWLIGFLGVTSPYYFLAILLYLANQFSWERILPIFSFSLPVIPSSVFITISIALLVIPFIIGGYYVQSNLNKMLIQVRKGWSLLLLLLIISLLMILVNGGNNYFNWIFCAISLTAFHAAAYYYPPNKIFPLVLHWITFAFALYVNYWL